MVSEPTRNDATLDLSLTVHPQYGKDVSIIDQINDHRIIFINAAFSL